MRGSTRKAEGAGFVVDTVFSFNRVSVRAGGSTDES